MTKIHWPSMKTLHCLWWNLLCVRGEKIPIPHNAGGGLQSFVRMFNVISYGEWVYKKKA